MNSSTLTSAMWPSLQLGVVLDAVGVERARTGDGLDDQRVTEPLGRVATPCS
jgi:hypothetical protein